MLEGLPIKDLDARAIAANDQFDIGLTLPDNQRVVAIGIDIDATVNNTAAGAVVVQPRQLVRLISRLIHESELLHINQTGRGLWIDHRMVTGRSLNNLGLSIAGGGGTGAMLGSLMIMLADENGENPHDGAQRTELLRAGKALAFSIASSLQIGAGGGGTQNVTAGNFRPYAVLVPSGGDKLPAELRIAFEQWQSQTVKLKGACRYPYLYGWDESDDIVTLSEYDHATVLIAGKPRINNARTAQLVTEFNTRRANGSTVDNESEQLPTTGNLLFLPIHTAERAYKMTQLLLDVPDGDSELELSWTGSATALRVGYRQLIKTKDAARDAAVARLGGDPNTVMYSASTMKGGIGAPANGPANERLLPKRFHR